MIYKVTAYMPQHALTYSQNPNFWVEFGMELDELIKDNSYITHHAKNICSILYPGLKDYMDDLVVSYTTVEK